jgi:isoquinoline 1-oxidoreductase alpha subunit
MALCGTCTVHVDGVATRSCITPIDNIGTSEITMIEAIGATAAGDRRIAAGRLRVLALKP